MLLDGIDDGEDIGIWDKVIVEFFYLSVLCLVELVRLNVEDIDFKEVIVRIMGKGNKIWIVFIGKKVLDVIQEWMMICGVWLIGYDMNVVFVI